MDHRRIFRIDEASDPGPEVHIDEKDAISDAQAAKAGHALRVALGPKRSKPHGQKGADRGYPLLAPANTEALPSRWGTSPRFLRWFLWLQILLGWLLATLLLAGLTGIIRKE